MTYSKFSQAIQDRTTLIPLHLAINPVLVALLVIGILAAVAWLFRNDL